MRNKILAGCCALVAVLMMSPKTEAQSIWAQYDMLFDYSIEISYEASSVYVLVYDTNKPIQYLQQINIHTKSFLSQAERQQFINSNPDYDVVELRTIYDPAASPWIKVGVAATWQGAWDAIDELLDANHPDVPRWNIRRRVVPFMSPILVSPIGNGLTLNGG